MLRASMSLFAVYYEVLALASKYNINSANNYSVAKFAIMSKTLYGRSSLAILYFRLHVVLTFLFIIVRPHRLVKSIDRGHTGHAQV